MERRRVHLDPLGHVLGRQHRLLKQCDVRVAAEKEPPRGMLTRNIPADYLYQLNLHSPQAQQYTYTYRIANFPMGDCSLILRVTSR